MDKEICYIYKIYCKDPEIKEYYIGSSKNLSKRISAHKNHCKSKDTKVYTYIREHQGWDNFTVEVLEEFECIDSIEKRQKERDYIELLKPTLNKNRAIIYSVDINEYQRVYMKKYLQGERKEYLKLYYRNYMRNYMRKIYLKRKMQKYNMKSQLLKDKLDLLKNGYLDFT